MDCLLAGEVDSVFDVDSLFALRALSVALLIGSLLSVKSEPAREHLDQRLLDSLSSLLGKLIPELVQRDWLRRV